MGDTSILLVEDEDAVRLTLRDYLQQKGYTVHVASDGAGAIQQLLDHEVQVIVSDYRMNILGGHYWVRFLQKYESDKIIVIASGYLEPDFSIPFPVIQKPFEYGDLVSLLEARLKDERKRPN